MHASRAPTHSQRASRVIAALRIIATTFIMSAMVGRHSAQFKMPRQAAYSARAVAQLLNTAGYSLQGNRKTLEGTAHPDRNAQFEYINAKVKRFQRKRSANDTLAPIEAPC